MRENNAAEIALRLAANWPGRATDAYVTLVAQKIQTWDPRLAYRAVERAIDTMTWLPSFAELRALYVGEGGDLPDPGRRMSPPTDPPRPPLTAEEEQKVAALREHARELAESLVVDRIVSEGAVDL